MSSQKKSFLTIPNVENRFCNMYETVQSSGEKNEDETFPVLHNFVETLKYIFSSSHRKLFLVLFQVTIHISLGFRKFKTDCRYTLIYLKYYSGTNLLSGDTKN